MKIRNSIPCRLCGGTATHCFDKRVLDRLDVAYYRCGSCRSIETQEPTWLEAAYAIPPNHIDVGAGSRTFKNWIGLTTLLDALAFPRTAMAVDFGSASGLLGRLMRDVGYNFHAFDKYATSTFSNYFTVDDPVRARPMLITAFEVFEHLPEPAVTLDELFSAGAALIAFTTWFCDDADENWVYFVEECGQHVFFYSEQAMRNIAARHGYELRTSTFFHVLVQRSAFTAAQHAALDSFILQSESMARARVTSIFDAVRSGNAHIDLDFDKARARFKTALKEDG
jgi:hypothetical protein